MTTMDFFGHQQQARSATRLLVVFFLLAVICIVAAIYLVAAALFQLSEPHSGIWNPGLLGAVTLGVLLVVVLASGYKTAQLRQGGAAVARLLGGRAVDPGTREPRERMLVNVVEEMAIAAGVPVPAVFVLAQEPGLNAFAAGWGTADAAVAVTDGCLDNLTRDELQGVIAHEFSHVFHGDMRLNIRLMGILFGIVCIATIGEVIVRTVGRSGVRGGGGKGKGGAAAVVLFGVALLAIGWIGAFFAGLIKAAISRQREFLADASAVAYTRNPLGIGMALARIGGLTSRLQSPHAREASHFFFADGLRRFFGGLGATHPPIEDRVERVLPGFRRELRRGGSMLEAAARTPPPAAAGFAGAAPAARGVASADLPGLVGAVQPQYVKKAQGLLASLPLDVVAAAREPARARALLYALLLGPDARAAQDAVLDRCAPEVAHEARALAPVVRRLDAAVRLPLVELLVGGLRRLPAEDVAALYREAAALARADAALTPFELALLKVVQRNVPAPGARPPRRLRRPLGLPAVLPEVALVLSVLARAGGDEAAAERSFAQGAALLAGLPPLALRPAVECRLADLGPALDRLADLSPVGKRLLLTACAHAAGADGVVAPDEGELLRAFAAHWDCPLPPAWTPDAVAVGS